MPLPTVTEKNFEQEVLLSEEPVLVEFGAEWCGPCKTMAPELLALAGELKGKAKIVTVDIDRSRAQTALQELTQREGLFVGVSCGSVVRAAIKASERLPGEQHIVCLLADGGWKYLSTGAYDGTLDDAEERLDGQLWA